MPPASLFLSAARAEALAAFRSPSGDAVSLHLGVDDSGLFPSTLTQVLADARRQGDRWTAFGRDLERLERFVRSEFVPGPRRFLAAYSCAKRGLFEAFALPQPFKSGLTAGPALDLRPLDALAGQYHRFGAVLLAPERARFVEIHLGEAEELGTLDGDFTGLDGLGRAAARVSALARERRFDRLILGAPPALEAAFLPLFDPALQKEVILEPLLAPDRPTEAVLERVLHNERQARRVRESVLVHRLLDEARQGGAVTGLEAVAAALQQGCVSRVLVRDGFTKMGRVCPACRHLSVDHRSCPWCFKPTETVLDLVAELAEAARARGCEVFRVMHDERFDGVCRIGAELTVPEKRPAPPPTGRSLRGRFALKKGRPSPLRPA